MAPRLAVTSLRFAPACASLTLFLFLVLAYPLIGRDVFVGMAGLTLIAFIHFLVIKNSR
jgi:hypothetical protein